VCFDVLPERELPAEAVPLQLVDVVKATNGDEEAVLNSSERRIGIC